MPNLLAQAAIGAAVSVVTGFLARKLAKKPKTETTLAPATPRPMTDNLTASVEVGSPLPGVFGHRRVGGKIVVSAKSGTKTYNVIMIAGAPVTAINAVFFNDRLLSIDGSDRVTTSPWAKNAEYSARVKLYSGAQLTADPWLTAAFPGWKADHVGKQIAYAVVEFDPAVNPTAFDKVYQAGTPDITFDVSGFRCYDPRNGAHNIADPTTWGYSSNAAIIKANYLIHALGAALPTSAVDWPSVTAAANICDQAVTLKAGGTEARYMCAAQWLTDERHEDVLARMNAADAGRVHLVGTKWRVSSGAAVASSASIGVNDYAGDGLSFSDTPPLAELVNSVRGKFSSPLHNYEDRDFPPWTDAAAVAADGREAWLDLDLAFVTSPTQAQRLAKIAYNRGRFGAEAAVTTGFQHFDVVADDVISLTDDMAGFAATAFRVVSEEVQDDFTIRFTLEREDASFWAWTAATDEKDFLAYEPLQGETGNPQPPGFWLYRSVSAPNVFVVMRYWENSSPTTAVDTHAWTYTTVTEVAASATTGGSRNLGSGGANFLASTVQGKIAATAELSAAVAVAGGTQASLTGADINTPVAPHYYLPPPRRPFAAGVHSGSVTLRVPQVPGSKSAEIELWENTTNVFGTATLLSTQTNDADGLSHVVSGTSGQVKFYWARTKNGPDSKFSPPSNAALIVF